MNKCSGDYGTSDFIDLIRNGTPIPKGHGRLIDVANLTQVIRPIELDDAYCAVTIETAKRLIHEVFNRMPTAVEADEGTQS